MKLSHLSATCHFGIEKFDGRECIQDNQSYKTLLFRTLAHAKLTSFSSDLFPRSRIFPSFMHNTIPPEPCSSFPYPRRRRGITVSGTLYAAPPQPRLPQLAARSRSASAGLRDQRRVLVFPKNRLRGVIEGAGSPQGRAALSRANHRSYRPASRSRRHNKAAAVSAGDGRTGWGGGRSRAGGTMDCRGALKPVSRTSQGWKEFSTQI